MSALFLLIGFSLVIAVGFLAAFMWATRAGQFDDDYTPSVRVVLDDPEVVPPCEGPQSSMETTTKA